MKKLFISLGLAAIMFAPSCSTDFAENDTLLNGTENGVVEGVVEEAAGFITVGIDNADTRLSVGEEAEGRIPLYWNTGDKLLVNRTIETLAISEEYNGKDVASFGLSEENLAKVTYPITLMYPASVSKNSDKHFYIPTEQAYLQGHLSNGYGILMGKAEQEGDVINLQHMCGYLKVSLTGSTTVKKVMLRTAGHEPLSGFFKHNETATEIGMTSYTAAGLADGYYNSSVISIDSAEGVVLSGEATDFYFALPAGVYSKGFVLHVLDSNNKQHRVKAYSTGKTIEAGVMIKMPALPVNCEKDWGIYDGNELASFGRTLDKNAWLGVNETTIYLRGDADLKNESFSDVPKDTYHRALISFRDGYSNDKITAIDGKKNETENYAVSNFTKETTTDGSMLFVTIPEHLTVQNLTLGKTADDPTTEKVEADCVLKLNPNETDYTYTSTFCYIVKGSLINCVNKASIVGAVTSTNGLKTGIFSANNDSATGTIDGCINYGSIIMDAANGNTAHYVGGIVGLNYGTLTNCKNYGAIIISNAVASRTNIGGIAGYAAANTDITSCTNLGQITIKNPSSALRVGGICGTGASTALTLANCVNGEKDSTTKGAISVTGSTETPNMGGVLGLSSAKMTLTNATNYAPISINGPSRVILGGVVGSPYSGDSGATVKNSKNYGAISVSGTYSNQSYFKYIGGVAGDLCSNMITCENYGNITINTAAKSRVGGLGGYVRTVKTNSKVECNITIEGIGANSNIGGLTGYSNNYTKSGFTYIGTITNKVNNTSICIGAVGGEMNGQTVKDCYIKAHLKNEGSGNATFGLITAGAVGTNSGTPYVLTLGADDAPVKISKQSTFLGISITDAASILDRPADGQNKPYLLNDANTAAVLTLARTNLTVVD